MKIQCYLCPFTVDKKDKTTNEKKNAFKKGIIFSISLLNMILPSLLSFSNKIVTNICSCHLVSQAPPPVSNPLKQRLALYLWSSCAYPVSGWKQVFSKGVWSELESKCMAHTCPGAGAKA